MTAVQALLIPADEETPVSIVTMEASYTGIKHTLDAYSAQAVDLDDENVIAWVHAEGKLQHLPVNVRASRLVNAFVPGWTAYDHVAGPAIFVGGNLDSEDVWDVPGNVVEMQKNLL